ncbi:Pyrethroid hydrolase [Xanthomonas sacchari]|uniref:alpha/beta fold hydrolase n=1 Tax=Xanthomonas TaxID=338 RepID=UPI00123CF487|nr:MULTISPECIES: alpha/beta hydrolase [Xanthomonas]KAA8918570.1 alpha/beta hydrolase [Xanthomonas sontii]MCW0378411.1 Pyrethroid hydrolase [Xanthomonas sacchari]
MQTYLLLHGSWHDGHAWDGVAAHLRARGVQVHAPTIAGHGPGADKRVSHADCVASVVDYVRRHDLRDLVVLGHSWGGSIVQRLAEEEPERCKRLIFHNAFVLRDGEALFDLLPPHYQALWKNAVDADGGIMLPFPIWRDGFIGDADLAQAQQAYAQLSPTPARSHFDAVPLKRFHELQIPRSWLYATDDVALPPGEYGWHPRLSARLGGYRLVSLPGSHEVCFSAPALLAEKILLAGRD